MSDESSVNLIISTFLGERRLFMDNIRLSNPSIRIVYGVIYGKYPYVYDYQVFRVILHMRKQSIPGLPSFRGWPGVEATTSLSIKKNSR